MRAYFNSWNAPLESDQPLKSLPHNPLLEESQSLPVHDVDSKQSMTAALKSHILTLGNGNQQQPMKPANNRTVQLTSLILPNFRCLYHEAGWSKNDTQTFLPS